MATFVGTSAMHLSLTHLAADNSIRCRARIDGQPATLVDYPAALSARGDKISIVAKDSEIDVWSAVVFATQ
ncbi:MAG: hypothetical protein H6Q90_7055 [Deltaproteobacteria bacterium]|nr:hypothetical protein [Deltaproteobacteria bacterium]